MKKLIVYVRCCRIWPIVLGTPVGPCGICGEVPREHVDQQTIDEYLAGRVGDEQDVTE